MTFETGADSMGERTGANCEVLEVRPTSGPISGGYVALTNAGNLSAAILAEPMSTWQRNVSYETLTNMEPAEERITVATETGNKYMTVKTAQATCEASKERHSQQRKFPQERPCPEERERTHVVRCECKRQGNK